MFAIIQNGGKQYQVKLGQFIRVDLLNLKVGQAWKGQMLAFQDDQGSFNVGNPVIKNTEVKGLVIRHGKSKKVLVFKKNRRKGYRKTRGHRQSFTELFIESITTPIGKVEKAKKTLQQKKD